MALGCWCKFCPSISGKAPLVPRRNALLTLTITFDGASQRVSSTIQNLVTHVGTSYIRPWSDLLAFGKSLWWLIACLVRSNHASHDRLLSCSISQSRDAPLKTRFTPLIRRQSSLLQSSTSAPISPPSSLNLFYHPLWFLSRHCGIS